MLSSVRYRLNYLWRLLMTAFAFSLFSVGGLLLTVAVFPWFYMMSTAQGCRQRAVRRCIQFTFSMFIKMLCLLGIMSLETTGVDRLWDAKGMLVLANHPTLIDVVLIVSRMPGANCVVKSTLWDNFFLGGVVRAAGYIRNDGESQTLVARCAESLNNGESLIIFPEGTRSFPGCPLKFLRGAAHIGLSSKANILPVVLTCTPPTLSKVTRWYQIPPRRFHMTLDVGNPLSLSDLIEDEEELSLAARRLTDVLQRYFVRELHGKDCFA